MKPKPINERITAEDIISAAAAHAEDSGDPEYAIGDLEMVLRRAWSLLSTRDQIVLGEEFRDLVEENLSAREG